MCKKNHKLSTHWLIYKNSGLGTKVSVFAQNQVNYQPHYPKGITWHFIKTKAIKHDYYSSLIM
jgi:hypothetical protein